MSVMHEENLVWNVLCISGELFSNDMTRIVLENMTFLGRRVRVFDAKCIDEAEIIFEQHKDIAVVLIDVEENKSQSYDFIRDIRGKYSNHKVRIVLRTGYSMSLPSRQVVEEYNIDGYIPKEVITESQIEITVMTSILGYQQILNIEKMMSCLAGTIAHEMRNPLSQIHGSLYMLERQLPQLNNNVYTNIAHKVIKSSFQLIDLTMDAIQDKPINKENFRIISAQELMADVISEYAYADVRQKHKVSVRGGDFSFIADPVLVKYVLFNLIGNALYYVKSLPNAEIVISLLPNTRQIEVRDNGPGIAPEAIPKLFDSFFTSGKSGGTGLGLAYCKRTMKALGGNIYCRSELGKYTAFFLTFPKVSKGFKSIFGIDRPKSA